MEALLAPVPARAGRDEPARLAALAEGSLGRALQLAEGGGAAYAELVSGVLAGLPAR